MSRVEPKERPAPARREAADRRQPVDRKPSQAEGDERTIDEALRNATRHPRARKGH